jgi:hypothetical protein
MTGYLVQFGRSAFVGRFSAQTPAQRGDQVVLRTPRGLELGSVLCEVQDRLGEQIDAAGELIRAAEAQDHVTSAQYHKLASQLLQSASELAQRKNLPLTFLDVEVMLDGSAAILHGLAFEACDADELFAELSELFHLRVQLLDVSRTPTLKDPPEKSYKCSKPGCGTEAGGCSSCSTGGGCSTGSCSKGSVKSAEELTVYFSQLREKMEAEARRHPLH